MKIEEIGYYKVAEFILREPPARDECLKVVTRDADMHEFGDFSEVARRESLHRHMTNEMTSVDMAAACVAEFPDAPWGLRLELARQAWDEARHVRVLYRRVKEMGGFKGEFPITTLEWDITSAVDNVVGRITIQNRTLEAGAMDVIGGLAQNYRKVGDDRTADMLDGINVDEIQHVRFANRWIKQLAKSDPRTLMKMAAAIRFLTDANAKFQIKQEGETNAVGAHLAAPDTRIPAVNVDLRQAAEFSEDEIHEILRQAGFRSLVPTGAQA
jgi:uncharacterized ferritin-like protein (DUF455 family)